MATRKQREIHDMQQTKELVPLITCEASFGYHVCELVLSVNAFNVDLGVQNDSVK